VRAYNRTDRACGSPSVRGHAEQAPRGHGGSRPDEFRLVTPQGTLDLERLFKLRVAVARVGEMDLAQWWNTKGQLGPLGAAALRRGLPRTHHFAQARSVFAVAAHRCAEVFDPPSSVTLWRLPLDIEDAFEARWEQWLDAARDWSPFFDRVAALEGPDLVVALQALELVDGLELAAFRGLKTSAEGRAVPISEPFGGTDADVTTLALGFARGRIGSVSVPYARVAGR
jgi:hypothetical protein